MNQLTAEQAEALKAIRPKASRISVDLEGVGMVVIGLCHHDGVNPDCPACVMWQKADQAEVLIDQFNRDLDAFLLRAEVPQQKP